ncbi:MAG: hypothetical protein VX780_01595 [Pseudomonadota bacterium]|nr:hypothetical protein [Pseudomonadota bacterium]
MGRLINTAKIVAIISTALAFIASTASALDVAKHYTDKRIIILVPYGPGGTYDKYAQTFSRHMEKFIPGKPNIIVQHMPGAGGAKAMNWAYNVMPKQGYNFLEPLDNTVINQLLRPKAMRYKSDKFTWLGSANQTNTIIVASVRNGISSIEDWKKSKTGLIGSSAGVNATSTLIPTYVMKALNLKGKIVKGYKGSSRAIMAIEQGEADMSCANWLAWASKVPHWFKGKKPFANPIVQAGIWRDPDLKTIPMLDEVVPEKYKAGARFLGSMGPLGRGLTLPPGVPKGLVAPLRKAFDKMVNDKGFQAELKKRRLRLIPTTGVDLQKTVKKALVETNPKVIAFVRRVIFNK